MKKIKAFFKNEKLRYPFYVLSHPIDGFYEIRHRGYGSVPLALLFVLIYGFCYSLDRIYMGYAINPVDPRTVDSIREISGIFLLFFLFCIGNWSVTCLMNGEGRFKDIIIVVGYSLLPAILTQIPATIISQFLGENEDVFYTIIVGVGLIYFVMMALVGIMTVHGYTAAKTLATLVLTVVAMLIIIFVVVMMSDLISQVYMFFYSVYTELKFRS